MRRRLVNPSSIRTLAPLFAGSLGIALGGWLFGCGADSLGPSGSPAGGADAGCGANCEASTPPAPTAGEVSDSGCDGACDGGSSEPLYPVYDGCEAPATAFTRTLFVDPATGADTGDGTAGSPFKTLAATLAAKKIQTGDHVVLKAGDHGAVLVSKYDNPQLVDAASWIWFDFQPGATAQTLDVRDMSRWLITGGEISSPGAQLVSISGGTNIILADAKVFTTKDSSSWAANDWLNVASGGINVRNTTCSTLVRNRLFNLRFALNVFTDDKDPATNKMKALVERNDIRNYSGDGMRPNGSDITFRHNRVVDEYLSAADGDDNHDDGLQMFALNGAVYDNILIESNWLQETTDPSRKFNASMQGISVFDGLITHLKVVDNVVLASAYHGIAGYGIVNGLIEKNTVQNCTENGNNLWIIVPDTKTGTPPSADVKDNIAVAFPNPEPTVTYTNDIVVANPADAFQLFDRTKAKFDLTAKAGSAIDGKGAGSSLKTIDDPRLLPQ